MKVNVLQVEDAKFKKFCWWSNWIDVAVYDYSSTPYLLQMKVNRFNKKSFKSTRMAGSIVYRQTTCREIGDLTSMSRKKGES
jgi:hypothetical protein